MAEQGSAVADRVPILALLGANVVSLVGDTMAALAVPWFILDTTGSAAKTGLTGGAIGVGTVVAALFGGPLVDRLGLRRASVLSDLASGAAVVAIPVLHVMGVLAFWQFLVLVLLVSILDAPGTSARRALIPVLARRAGMPLERANVADTVIPRVAQAAGPLLGGVLIALIGATNVLVVDAATFLVSAALVAVGVPSGAGVGEDTPARGRRAYLPELLEGLRFLRTNALILSMVLVVAVANVVEVPLVQVIMPVYARTVYGGAASLGVVLAAFGAGAVAGTLLFGAVGRHWPRRLTFTLCLAAASVLIYGTLAATPPLLALVIASGVGGFILGPTNPLFATVLQEHTPPEILGRVLGAIMALTVAGIPLGAALVGFAVEGVGLVPTILGMGAMYLAVTLGMFLFNPALRLMDAGRQHAVPGESSSEVVSDPPSGLAAPARGHHILRLRRAAGGGRTSADDG